MKILRNKVYAKEDTFTVCNDIEVRYTVATKNFKEFNKNVEFFEGSSFKNAIDTIVRYLSTRNKIDAICAYIENGDIKLSIVFDNGRIWKNNLFTTLVKCQVMLWKSMN